MGNGDPLDYAMEHLQGARRYAKYVSAICPFHGDTSPSLLVYADGYRCLACGAHGPLEKLWQRADLRVLPPPQAQTSYRPYIPEDWSNERLARSAHNMLLDKPGLQQYLIDRGLERAIRRCDLGYWDGWYTVPVKDKEGEVDEIVFRAGPWIQGKTGQRFYQRGGQKPRLYIPDWRMAQRSSLLFLTFGLFDAISLSLLGYPAATSTIGKGSIKPEWLADRDSYLVIVPDLEEEKEANILAAQLGWRGRVLLLPYPEGCKDPNDLLIRYPDLLRGSLHEFIGSFSNRVRSLHLWEDQPRGHRSVQPGATL